MVVEIWKSVQYLRYHRFCSCLFVGNVSVFLKVTVFPWAIKALLGTTGKLVAVPRACKGLRATTPELIAFSYDRKALFSATCGLIDCADATVPHGATHGLIAFTAALVSRGNSRGVKALTSTALSLPSSVFLSSAGGRISGCVFKCSISSS